MHCKRKKPTGHRERLKVYFR